MSLTTQTFRGYHAISEVIDRVKPLGAWCATYRPECKTLTLRRADLDLLQRWPQAASLHDVVTVNGITWWNGFELRADKSRNRYLKDAPPQQRVPSL